MRRNLFLLIVFFLAFVLRFYQLGINPPSLYWDETINCYDAYSLSQTGKDHHGQSWPITYLTSYNDYKNPLYTYLDILPVKILGLNEFSCRLPSALFGWLTVVLIYFLVKELFYKGVTQKGPTSSASGRIPLGASTEKEQKSTKPIAMMASLLLAVSPWHLQFSRAGFEANINLFFLVLGIYLFLKAVNGKPWILIFSSISFALTPYAYHSSKIFMPLLVTSLAMINLKFFLKNLKWAVFSLIVGLIMIYPLTTKEARKAVTFRFTETNIFNEGDVVLTSNKLRSEDNWSFFSNIIHNRRVLYLQKFLKHYFDHFKFDYLFLTGDSNLRHSTQAVGELYLIELPFLLAGLYFLIKNKEKRLLVPIVWLLLSPIPASLTISTPHAIRTLAGLGSWQIITAYGIYQIAEIFEKKRKEIYFMLQENPDLIGDELKQKSHPPLEVSERKPRSLERGGCHFFTFIFSLFAFSLIYYFHYYYKHYPKASATDWQYGYKEAITFIKENYFQYEKIIMTDKYGRAYGYLLFYLKYPPEKIQQVMIEKRREGKTDNNFDKFKIGSINWPENKNKSGILLIGGEEEFPKQIKAAKLIKGLNNEIIFKIVSL